MFGKEKPFFEINWEGKEIIIHRSEIDAAIPDPALLEIAKEQFTRHMDYDGIHGIRHWNRVLENGLVLARLNGADPKVVALFSIFHDCQRVNEGLDGQHGPAAARFLVEQRNQIPLDDGRFELLHRACQYHNSPVNKDLDLTVMTCWDADRLDLDRVGKKPNPRYLCTKEARDQRIIDWAVKRSHEG